MIFCLWFGLRPSCQVHITDNVGNNSISIMLNTVTSTRATQTVVTVSLLAPKSFFATSKGFQIESWLPPISHLYCDRVKVSASHIRIGKPAQRSDPSESDSRCAERGWEARHRLVSQVGASSRLTSTPTPARPLLCAPPQQCWQATQSRNRKAIWCLFGTVHRQDEMYMCVSAVMSAWMFVSVCVWCVCHQCV